MPYLRRTYRAPAEREEELGVAIWDQGSLGWEVREAEIGEVELVAWYEKVPEGCLELPDVSGDERGGVVLTSERWIEAEDWLAEYRAHARPRWIGERFLIDSREPDEDPVTADERDGRILLRLPAREAFGTGSHASTRLVLSWLEELPIAGSRVLDVGCGSGILSLGALALGARRVLGFDLDRVSSLLAGENVRRNEEVTRNAGGLPWLLAGGIGTLAPSARFDFVLVNVLPHRVERDVVEIVSRLDSGGVAVVSGFLDSELDSVLARWTSEGLVLRDRRREEEWAALLLEAPR